jgi:hypothetical protein
LIPSIALSPMVSAIMTVIYQSDRKHLNTSPYF